MAVGSLRVAAFAAVPLQVVGCIGVQERTSVTGSGLGSHCCMEGSVLGRRHTKGELWDL